MFRMFLTFALLVPTLSSANGIGLFNRHWNEHYLTDSNLDGASVKQARRAGCYICHIKGKEKQSSRNEYGEALSKYLDADDLPEDWVEENSEEAKRRIIAAFRRVEEDLQNDLSPTQYEKSMLRSTRVRQSSARW